MFIDELDRCAPKDVVATLETIRTFLDVRGCVFVVAADQQVLERALQEASGQANPADPRNPYYSAGSEYLDKTFQHQVHLPPLLPRRLTQFALDLTEDRDGCWSEIDRAEVIPVLVPTHVRSPRRVKALLNSFAMSYRIARDRLETDLVARAPELATLVCLRCEFPLFAADLTRDAGLPQYVLEQLRDEPLPNYLSAEIRELAEAYANATAPVAGTMLDDEEDEERTEVEHAHTEQLLAYLQKTEHVGRIGRDLVHLEGTGVIAGLDEALAEQLENFSVNGLRDEVARRIGQIEDEAQQRAALRHLAQVTREASVGIEGRNGVSCLLAAASAAPELDLQDAGPEIAAAIAAHLSRYTIQPKDLQGAFLLATRTPLGDAAELMTDVLTRDELLTDEQFAITVLGRLDSCLPEHEERIATLARIVHEVR